MLVAGRCTALSCVVVNRVAMLFCAQARSTIQDLMRKAVAKTKAQVPEDTDAIVALLSETLAPCATSPGEKSVNLFFNERSAQDVQRWVMSNNSEAVLGQASYVAVSKSVCDRLGLGPKGTVPQISLADICFTFAEVIFDNVPCAVPAMTTALCVKAAEFGPCDDCREKLPAFCHCLCGAVDVEMDDQDVPGLCCFV